MQTIFTCHQCKQEIAHESDFSTGYGIDKDGNKICFACCGENDKKELESLPIGGKTMHYLSMIDNKANTFREKYKLTNWPGTLEIRPYYARTGRHNIAGKRLDVWFKFDGKEFHGIQYGHNTQICHIKRIKN